MAADEKTQAKFRIVINGPIDRVFHELTRTDQPQQAVFNARMHTTKLAPGGHFQMRTSTGKHTLVIGEILEYAPPHRYAHTHRFTQHDDPFCRVTYDLRSVDGGTEVTMTVDDLPVGTRTAKDMLGGGDMILKSLKAVIEEGRPSLGTRMLYGLFGAIEWVLPARTKSEHWPLDK